MVYLVGAGMGSEELITLRGLKCIQKADVIVYDRLANPSLLNYAKDGCLLIYAGKQAGSHHMAQEEINKTLVRYGRDKCVVRLKGGDPFVFGRGGEEIEELVKNGIDYELVPGVSSSYGAAEYAGISVTHRGTASSFHVVTGHEKTNADTVDYSVLARLHGTLVFLMGLGNAKAIYEKLTQYGRDGDTKTAIISNAGAEKQESVVGTLKTLPEMANGMRPPAVIVVGDVVDLRNEWYCPSQKKILATGTQTVNANIKAAFGDIPVTEISLIRITEINYDAFLHTDFTVCSHIAFTSANGAHIFLDYMKRAGLDVRQLAGVRIAAVGDKTALALREYGITADILPKTHCGAALAESLLEDGAENVLLVRAENGANGLSGGLRKNGIQYTDLPVYKTESDDSKRELLNLTAPDMDYIIFSSGSAARAYAEMAEGTTGAKFISIGAETTKAAEECGIDIYKTAKTPSAEGIAKTIFGDEKR